MPWLGLSTYGTGVGSRWAAPRIVSPWFVVCALSIATCWISFPQVASIIACPGDGVSTAVNYYAR